MRKLWPIIVVLAILGALDSGYLTYEHFADTLPPCTNNIFVDCGQVLRSKYAVIFGIPLALLGFFHYLTLTAILLRTQVKNSKLARQLAILQSTFGFLFSLYLMYLQLFVIGSICLYCTLSALISTILFVLIQTAFPLERKKLFILLAGFLYRRALKPVLFLTDADKIHHSITALGQKMGNVSAIKSVNKFFLAHEFPELTQKIVGIEFKNPIGLAAGFDYEAQLTQLLPSLGFGFATVGTVTNMPYEGNPPPRLGRLPRSKSLMVNKGFKSSGAKAVSQRLANLDFEIPIGVSIGRTNSPKLKTQKDSISDIIFAFKTFEKSKVKHSYYELNISCPNLIHGDISFYPTKNLKNLLSEVDKLKLKKPVFVKMPIEKSDKETLAMLDVIANHSAKGVIFGNLQKDRKHKTFDPKEVQKFSTGNFSGRPTFERSNKLIKLAHINFKNRFVIIGCGGVFSGDDAFEKIALGASLIQLITGLIFEGPQLALKINFELEEQIRQYKFKNIKDVIGIKATGS